jgi:hypothetical protein
LLSSIDVHDYFASIRRPIPPHYNPADYLIEVLFTYGDVSVATQVRKHLSSFTDG